MLLQLLSGVTAVVRTAPLSPATEQAAAASLGALVHVLHSLYLASLQEPAHLLPAVAAAMELADLLLNGGAGSRQGRCSCGMSGGSSTTTSSRCGAAAPSDRRARQGGLSAHVAAMVHPLLAPLCTMQLLASTSDAAVRLLESKGSHLLHLQYLALCVAAARAPPATCGQRGRRPSAASASASASASSDIPSCTELASFLGHHVGPDLSYPIWNPEGQLFQIMNSLTQALEAPGGAAAACPRCTPQQIVLVLEAAARTSLADATTSCIQLNMLTRLFAAMENAWQPWMASEAYMPAAARILTAWLPAAAQQLGAGGAMAPAAGASGASSSGGLCASVRRRLASAMLHAVIHVLLKPGGVIQAYAQHSEVAVQQLLGSCELLLRTEPSLGLVARPGTILGLAVLQVCRAACLGGCCEPVTCLLEAPCRAGCAGLPIIGFLTRAGHRHSQPELAGGRVALRRAAGPGSQRGQGGGRT
jgi:hypothetical protein